MRFLTRLRLAFRDLFRPRTVDREANEELIDWVETLTERHAAHGLSRDAARRAALVELGGLERVKDDARSIRRGVRLETTLQDIRLAARALGRTPGVTAAIVMTFALGLGGNAAIFSVVKTVLIEPLPYRDPDRLMFVWADVTDLGYPRAPLAGPEVADFQAHSKAFESFGGVWSTTSSLSGDGDPEQLRIATVTTEFFKVLGVPAALGEVIGPAHFNQTVRPVLLSHALWTRRYAADPSIVGRTITMNDRPAIVVGVMPADFVLWFPSDSAIPSDLQAWVPGSARLPQDPRGQQYLRVVGRLRAGVTTAEAQQEIAAIGAQIVRQWPTNYTPHYRFYSVPMQADTVQSVKPALLVVFAGAGILLLIACVNVAGLLIVRAASRRRDAAVRLALGAGRARLFRQYLVEGLLLAGIGGLVGIALSRAGLQFLVSLAPQRLARIGDAQIDSAVLAFAAVLVCGWAILFSLAPLSEVLRMRLTTALQQAGRAAGIVLQQRSRRVLVVAQIALGVLLLVGAALLGRAFDRLMRIDVGFSSERVITFRVAVPASRYRSLDAQNTFHRRMLESLAGLPGVSSVGAVSHLPYDNLPNWGTPYLPDGENNPARAGLADARNVAPGFFRNRARETRSWTLFHGRRRTGSRGDRGRRRRCLSRSRLAGTGRGWQGAPHRRQPRRRTQRARARHRRRRSSPASEHHRSGPRADLRVGPAGATQSGGGRRPRRRRPYVGRRIDPRRGRGHRSAAARL